MSSSPSYECSELSRAKLEHFKLKGKRSRAELKILQIELRLEPAQLGHITSMYDLHTNNLPSIAIFANIAHCSKVKMNGKKYSKSQSTTKGF